MDLFRPDIEPTAHVKMLFNVGGPWDTCTGEYLIGHNGRWVLNGGLPNAGGWAIVGPGNSFKSTILHCLQLSLASNFIQTVVTGIDTLDTEVNVHHHHLHKYSMQFPNFDGANLFQKGVWRITDSTKMSGEGFYKSIRDLVTKKKKHRSKLTVETAHMNREGTGPHKSLLFTQAAIDSFTDFTTSEALKNLDKLSLDDVKNNMIPMHKGLIKDRLLTDLPELLVNGGIIMGFTAHVGKNKKELGSPSHLPPDKSLSTMRAKDKIKGVTERFFFSMGIVYQVMHVKPEVAPDKGATYPWNKADRGAGVDLNVATLRVIRSKSSQSGVEFKAIISQRLGLDINLSAFHNLKINKRYGLPGNDRTYACEFLQEVKITRQSIWQQLREIPALRRGIEICSDLYYIDKLRLMPDDSIPPTPAELNKGLTELGYDWTKILATRGRHGVNEKDNPVECYSTMDLIYALNKQKGFELPKLKLTNK